jgi:cytochrome oxidase Cu insertion factor (SCO1/SenC/PrrC family)
MRPALGLLAALAVLAGCGGSSAPAYVGSRPPDGIRLPSFSLRDYRGGRVTSGSLAGKAIAITFLDTKCREACPVIAQQAGRARRLLTSGERADTAVYAVSVDPRVDTPATVRTFLRRQRAEGALGYLLGTTRELRPVWRAFHVLPAIDTGRASIHSAPVRIYAPDGTWVSELDPTVDLTPKNLAHDLREALEAS